MYIFRPSNWFRRSSSKSTGGGSVKGSSGGAGRTSGSSSGSGSGSSGSSKSGGSGGGSSGGSSGGSTSKGSYSSSGRTGSTLRSGASRFSLGRAVRVTNARQMGSSMRSPIYSRPNNLYYNDRNDRPLVVGYVLLFGFWPIIWVYDYPPGSLPTNNTRPGGSLTTASLIPAGISSSAAYSYVIHGDQQSIEDIIPVLIESCSAANTSSTFNSTLSAVMQMYREDSFSLMGLGENFLKESGRNSSFEACLNETIADNLLILESGAGMVMGPLGAMWSLVAVLVFLSMSV